MCLNQGGESDKEFGFRKAIKKLDKILFYGENEPLKIGRELKYDPIEDNEAYQRVELDVERKINMELGDERYRGYCHRYWSAKKRILKEDYGIEWKTPAEMKPFVHFD